MTQRRIISPALIRIQNAAKSATQGDGRAENEISLHNFVAPVILVIVTNCKDLIDVKAPDNRVKLVVIVAAVLTLAILLSQHKQKHKMMEAIALYPLGIQLGCIPVCDPNSSDVTLTPKEFWQRDCIIDCVVTEVLYSHKVQSMVMLRIKQEIGEFNNVNPTSPMNEGSVPQDDLTDVTTRTRNARESATGLIRLFLDVEMTHVECLAIRYQINNYLQNDDASVRR